MGEGIQFLDIIIFAMIAVFLVMRLRSMLGRRTGHERRRDPFAPGRAEEKGEKIVPLPDRNRPRREEEEVDIARDPLPAPRGANAGGAPTVAPGLERRTDSCPRSRANTRCRPRFQPGGLSRRRARCL